MHRQHPVVRISLGHASYGVGALRPVDVDGNGETGSKKMLNRHLSFVRKGRRTEPLRKESSENGPSVCTRVSNPLDKALNRNARDH